MARTAVMAGKRHTKEFCIAAAKRSRTMWATQKAFGGPLVSEEATQKRRIRSAMWQASRPPGSGHSRAKGGKRADIGDIHFRSSWEANYARYLNMLIRLGVVEHWEYEPETFWFEGVRRGAVSYRPDFRVKYKGDDKIEYIEVKGWEVPKDRTKWKRMKKYHPSIKLIICGAKEYYELRRKWASTIQNWE